MTQQIHPLDVPIAAVRDLAREHAERSSLRLLAPEIGLGHTTLHNFLGGAAPHPRVRRLLGLWYLRVTGSPEDKLHPYVAALDVLLEDVHESARARARLTLLACVSDHVYGASGGEAPDWLAALRARQTGPLQRG